MLVNIIVPVYNANKYLEKSVYSLLKQTYKNIKIILIDDGSTDGSSKICDNLEKNFSNIIVKHTKNQGSIKARLEGIKMIEGKGYTTFCDADDYMPKDGIEKLVNYAVESNADITVGTLQRILSKHIKLKKIISPLLQNKKVFTKKEIISQIIPSFFGISNFTGYMHTKMYKNDLIKKSINFETPVKFFQEDIAFNLQAVLESTKIAVMPETVYYYRMGGGTSHFMPDYLYDCISLYSFKMAQIKKNKFSNSLEITTKIELKNELYCWLEMFFIKNYINGKGKNIIFKEIERCLNINEIRESVTYTQNDMSGCYGFKELVSSKNSEEIYKLLLENYKKNKFKRIVKNLINKIM